MLPASDTIRQRSVRVTGTRAGPTWGEGRIGKQMNIVQINGFLIPGLECQSKPLEDLLESKERERLASSGRGLPVLERADAPRFVCRGPVCS